jgi:hypothetical protein
MHARCCQSGKAPTSVKLCWCAEGEGARWMDVTRKGVGYIFDHLSPRDLFISTKQSNQFNQAVNSNTYTAQTQLHPSTKPPTTIQPSTSSNNQTTATQWPLKASLAPSNTTALSPNPPASSAAVQALLPPPLNHHRNCLRFLNNLLIHHALLTASQGNEE